MTQDSSRPGVLIVCLAGPNLAATNSQVISGLIFVIPTVKITYFF
jgi:hypothetical protein